MDTRDVQIPGRGLEQTFQPLSRASHLPGYIYNSPEVFQLEKEKVFLKDWLFVARLEEIEAPGDFMTLRIMDEPIIVTRDRDGSVNAFSNMCAHRGVEVAAGKGNVNRFMCPYHGWSYDLAGKLQAASYMREAAGFDPANCRLNPLNVGVWAGNIFVNFNKAAEPFETFIAEYEKTFGFLNQGDCRLAYTHVIEWNCNWKFVLENLMDVYHFQTLHAATFGNRINVDDFSFDMTEKGGSTAFYQAAPMTPDGKSRFGPMPWMADRPESFGCYFYIPPNMIFMARYDYVRPYVIWPVSPTRSRGLAYSLFPKEHFALPDFQERLKVYTDFYYNVAAEDQPMIETLQNITTSRLFVPGRMSRLEKAVHNTMVSHVSRLFGEPDAA